MACFLLRRVLRFRVVRGQPACFGANIWAQLGPSLEVGGNWGQCTGIDPNQKGSLSEVGRNCGLQPSHTSR